MRTAKIVFLFFLSLQTIQLCQASAIGVVPDRIVFNGTEERMMIVNPDDLAVGFRITADEISCEPAQGRVAAKDKTDVVCEASEHAKDGVIIVEMEGDDKKIGVLPAVAIKADIIGDNADLTERTKTETPAGLLEITGKAVAKDNTSVEEKTLTRPSLPEGLQGMGTELVTIALLVVSIVSVLIYTEIKKRKHEMKKDADSTSAPCASSRQDAQDDQPSASTAASHDQPLSAPLHDAQAQSLPASHPGQGP